MKTSDLKKWDKNPRKITPSKARILAKNLLEFGDLSGVVYNKKLDKLVGGHQRISVFSDSDITITEKYKSPTKQGTTALGYITMDGERYSYREVSWDEKLHEAASIAANNNAGEWDFPELKDILSDLDDGAFDMEMTGFDLAQIEDILGKEPDEPSEKSESKDKDVDLKTCPSCGVLLVE